MSHSPENTAVENEVDAQLLAAEVLSRRLDRPMGILGIVFLFVVLGQLLVKDAGWTLGLFVTGWVFWAVFVAEFLLRASVARFQLPFWKRNWWQVIFLLVPFLRFFRALQALRVFRVARIASIGGILSASVRGSRSAGRLLSNRIGWLIAVTAVVILASSQLLYLFESHPHYSDALLEAALATITGTGITTRDGFSKVLAVVLAVYSVGIFATVAGSVGAFFLRGTNTAEPTAAADAEEADAAIASVAAAAIADKPNPSGAGVLGAAPQRGLHGAGQLEEARAAGQILDQDGRTG